MTAFCITTGRTEADAEFLCGKLGLEGLPVSDSEVLARRD